jgi:hypothetical protein
MTFDTNHPPFYLGLTIFTSYLVKAFLFSFDEKFF